MFDEGSKDGNCLIDFLFHGKNARKSFKKEILDDFFQFLNDNIQEGEEIEEAKKKVVRKYIPCELGIIVITKV